jgi:phosphoribosyl-dephospho-CoA transferase
MRSVGKNGAGAGWHRLRCLRVCEQSEETGARGKQQMIRTLREKVQKQAEDTRAQEKYVGG